MKTKTVYIVMSERYNYGEKHTHIVGVYPSMKRAHNVMVREARRMFRYDYKDDPQIDYKLKIDNKFANILNTSDDDSEVVHYHIYKRVMRF